jgi:hypothetical protein
MGVHESEELSARVYDGKYEDVTNANISWTSSDTSVVTVDNTGTLKGIKAGTATVTASVAGATDTCDVEVIAEPEFTDFSNAKYELLFDTETDLKITGITPKDDYKNSYYYIITSNNTKPEIKIDISGYIDTTNTAEKIHYLRVNSDENYIYALNLDEYVELNQDLYLWVIQTVELEERYKVGEQYVTYETRFVTEGKKLSRPDLPQLNLILKTFSIGSWGNTSSSNNENYTYINFLFPTATDNRKFTIKIGKVTDNSILQKIQKNDYSGITELLAYAKKNNAIYTNTLTTTRMAYYRNEASLFDGSKLLNDGAYYYIYVEFNDENGKYYPIEGVTLGQAYISSTSNYWDLWAYTSTDFKWNNLSSTYTSTNTTDEELPSTLPYTGITSIITVVMIMVGSIIYFKVKSNKYKGI